MHQILFLGLFPLRTTQVLFNIFGKAQTLEDFLYHKEDPSDGVGNFRLKNKTVAKCG